MKPSVPRNFDQTMASIWSSRTLRSRLSREQVKRLSEGRKTLLAYELDEALQERTAGDDATKPDPVDEAKALAWLTAQIDRLLALSDDEVEERTRIYYERRYPPEPERIIEPAEVEPEPPAPLRVIEPPQAPETARTPPPVMVFEAGSDPDWDRGWRRLE